MNEYYTYAYLREDGTPYYIGKGKGKRIFDRENRTSCPIPKDKKRIVYLKKNLSEHQAFCHEVYMISILGRKNNGTGILRNLTDGGEGFSSAVMKEFWERRRNKKIEKWRKDYDKNMEWRNENYEFFNTLIQSVINNRNHVYNHDTVSIN
jgi:hypothetical protein